MFCEKCIVSLSNNLSKTAKKMFKIISQSNNGMTRKEIQDFWKENYNSWNGEYDEELSVYRFNTHIKELEGAMLITHERFSQIHVYGLTENGNKLLKLMRGSEN